MRSIFAKITLAFVFVSLVGAVLAAFFIQQRTRSAFDRFLFDQNKDAIIEALIQHYQDVGSWTNVGQVFLQFSPEDWNEIQGKPPPDNAPPGGLEVFRFPYILVDADGHVVYGRAPRFEQSILSDDLKKGVPLEVDGKIVGWLLSARTPPEWERGTPQGTFWNTVNQAILFSAIGTLVIALLLGSLLARSLTSSLRELAAATKEVAQGKLGYQVKVRSKDEIGQLAESFNQMSADLEKSNALRKQMTADIAHDLRNPLSIVLGYTEALSDGKLPGSQEIYTTMHQVAQHLSRLVDDLRTISLADAGELSIYPQRIAPATILERTAAAYNSQAEAKNVSLLVKAEPDLPEIEADAERMAQVMGNLMVNALRYTPEGGQIELITRAEGQDVLILVRDNGSGIAPEDLPNIFTRFYRGDKSRQNNGDVGLGLTIAKSLVEAHGGSISVTSEPGKGTTFTIRLPSG